MRPGVNKSVIKSFDNWFDTVYRISTGISQLNRAEDDRYVAFNAAVGLKDTEQKEKTAQLRQEMRRIRGKQSGYQVKNYNVNKYNPNERQIQRYHPVKDLEVEV